MKEEVYTQRSLKTGGLAWGSTMVLQEAEGVRQTHGQSLYCGFCGKEWARWGRYAEQV